jgi:uncharacterized protein
MDTYRVDVKSILDALGESIDVSDTLPMASLDVGDEHFGLSEPIRFTVTLTNGGTGIVAMGTVIAETIATCARCLIEFPLTIEAEVDGYYVQQGDTENIPEEQEFAEIDAEGYVDIMPAVMSAMVLEAPFAPLHADDCAGICPECGADLNSEPCDCASEPAEESPFAALGGLLGNEPDAEDV